MKTGRTLIKALALSVTTLTLFSCAPKEGKVWTAEKANGWYAEKGWISGCDYIPAYAINQLEMWQDGTFDINAIDRELGWAEDLGFNCMRVFLHHVLWETDAEGLKDKMNLYLDTSSKHGISTMFVFLDDCWCESYAPGVQPEPVKGSHNSGWVKDPGSLYFGLSGSGCDYAADTTAIVGTLKAYVTDILTTFKDDPRIWAWDLYNEPGGGQDPHRYWERSFPLLKDVFSWARKVNPSQPLTAGVWNSRLGEMNVWQIENSDIITYHTYEDPASHQAMIDTLKAYGKPLVCTEYMARTQKSTFQDILPMLRRENVGAINWGFVSGKTNTIFDWDTMHKPCPTDEPELWFHDVLRPDGTPYSADEAECIKAVNGKSVDVVPCPKDVKRQTGWFDAKGAKVRCSGLSKEERELVREFGHALSGSGDGESGGTIRFLRDPGLADESYRMEIGTDGVTVSSSSFSGTLYAVSTLKQLLAGYACPDTASGSLACSAKTGLSGRFIPCMTIDDSPRFAYRGLELDCSRHFFSIDEVKKLLDLMADYKLNRFHWHLTDDHGWRVEIKKYPRLTEIGAWRNGTMVDWDANHNDGIRYGGFYTQEQLRDVVRYARSKGIEIVPEIDLPAHLVSALTAYPELGCTGGPYEVYTVWDIAKDVLCVGKESSFEFLDNVFSEICDIFPGEYIHIGGDECPKERWRECPACQAKIRELGLKDSEDWTAEHYLQNYVTARVQKMLAGKGRKVIGWDEILDGELAPGATVMSWRGVDGGIRAAENGFDAIMTPVDYCYLDYCQGSDPMREPVGIGHYLPLEKCYSYEPLDGIPQDKRHHILGVQANLWTEFIKTTEHLEYMLLPRLLAISEVQWSTPENKNWNRFRRSVAEKQIPLLRAEGYTVRDLDTQQPVPCAP